MKHHRKWEFSSLVLSGQGHLTWHYFHLTYKKTKTKKKVLATQTNQIYPVPESKSMLKSVWVYGAVSSQGAFIMRLSDYSWLLSLLHLLFASFLSSSLTGSHCSLVWIQTHCHSPNSASPVTIGVCWYFGGLITKTNFYVISYRTYKIILKSYRSLIFIRVKRLRHWESVSCWKICLWNEA